MFNSFTGTCYILSKIIKIFNHYTLANSADDKLMIFFIFSPENRSSWLRRRCLVAFVTRASNWYLLTDGQGLLSLQQVRVEGECYFFYLFTFFHFPLSSLSFSFISTISSLFFLSLGENTKWPTRVDVLFNPNAINPQKIDFDSSCKVAWNVWEY